MKKSSLKIIKAIFVILFAGITSLYAENSLFNTGEYSGDYSLYADSTTYVAQLNADEKGTSNTENSSDINVHKILGWSTIVSTVATVTAIGLGKEDIHCGLAYTSTALALATCTTGYYSYSDVFGSDPRYTTHALLGTLATAGFGTALALADSGPHVVAGASSGIVFAITVGIVSF